MSIIGSNILAGASGQGGGGYTIENSLRFRSSASAYLSRAQGSATSTTTGTWSGWCKRGKLGAQQFIWSSSNYDFLQFNSDDTIRIAYLNNLGYVSTAAVYRDPSAWYHIVLVFDTTNATAVDRMRLYVNGVQQTLAWGGTSQTQNATFQRWNVSGYTGDIGDFQYNHINFFDGYMAECYWVDGQALDPSSFGEYNADTGVWQPVAYEGTYGNNGFYLPFSDATNTTTLVADSSGNGNDWTPNNISLTSGSTYDSMTDTPTPYADGGNYCVLNPLNTTNGTLAQGNLYWSSGGASGFLCTGTIAFDIADTVNKYYFEIQLAGGDGAIGIAPTTLRGSDTGRAGSYSYYTTGSKYNGVTASAYGEAFGAPNIIGVAVGAGKITFYKNGVSQGDAFTGLTGLFVPMLVEVSGTFNANFGQRPFAYTPPTGFLPLHTGNLPDSTIVDGSTAFDVVLYTGNGTGQSITGLEFQPDFVWGKSRNNVRNHNVYDSVRGAGNMLLTNGSTQELTGGELTGFNTDGFTLGSNVYQLNASGDSMVAWNWKANGTGVSNTDGSITSTVSANSTAGFSIVSYTGTGSNATVGHGLGVAPKLIIAKDRTRGDRQWPVYHASLGAVNLGFLNLTNAWASSPSTWNSTVPTSTVFSLGSDATSNQSGDAFIAYCFADVEGYSKFGSYTGNGNPDGVFVYLGFRPKFVMVKRHDSVSSWWMLDGSRDTFNLATKLQRANEPLGEETSYASMDMLSNGFKLRVSASESNASNGKYIYMAFAENPFKNSLAR